VQTREKRLARAQTLGRFVDPRSEYKFRDRAFTIDALVRSKDHASVLIPLTNGCVRAAHPAAFVRPQREFAQPLQETGFHHDKPTSADRLTLEAKAAKQGVPCERNSCYSAHCMKYYVQLDPSNASEVPTEVDVKELPSGKLDVRIAGRAVDVDLAAIGTRLSFRIDNRVVDLTTEGSPPDLGAIVNGHRSYLRVQSERLRAADAAKGARKGASDKVLKSPMPGRIVKVIAQPGVVVETGSPLIVMEAMKMENELRAKGPGTVAELKVKVGDTVELNQVLLTFQG
jgi:biotin carboxyl carrier protein